MENLHLGAATASSFRTDCAAESGFQEYAVTRRQHARRLIGANGDPRAQRRRRVMDVGGKLAQPERFAERVAAFLSE